MALTLFSLVTGIVLMGFGGKLNKKYSRFLMTSRVALQFLSVIALFLLFMYKK
ncbi:MAG: hypothetical protein SFT91_04620 [Rickettsiaceae bacterium]|nr:hypothetical protein [Rickettsiaceae bacterium]